MFSENSFRGTGEWDNQSCVKTLMLLPFPTFHCAPSLMISLAARRLRQTKDGLLPSSTSMKEHFGKVTFLVHPVEQRPIILY